MQSQEHVFSVKQGKLLVSFHIHQPCLLWITSYFFRLNSGTICNLFTRQDFVFNMLNYILFHLPILFFNNLKTHTYTYQLATSPQLSQFIWALLKLNNSQQDPQYVLFLIGDARGLQARGVTVNEVTVVSSCKKTPFLYSFNTSDSTRCNAGSRSVFSLVTSQQSDSINTIINASTRIIFKGIIVVVLTVCFRLMSTRIDTMIETF